VKRAVDTEGFRLIAVFARVFFRNLQCGVLGKLLLDDLLQLQ